MWKIGNVLLCVIFIFTVGCTENAHVEDVIEGYIFDIESGRILVVYDVEENTFQQIKEQSLAELVAGEEYIPLIYLSLNDTDSLDIGDQVKVWIDGGIDDSHPQQAAAKKIKVIQ